MSFRELTRQEQTVVGRGFGRWGVFDALKGKKLLLREPNHVCMVSSELANIMRLVQPNIAGLLIGTISKKRFAPSIAGAGLFANLRALEEKKYYVWVGETAEKLLLYGRDVMGESIIEASSELGENELVILLNSRHEGIGIGKTRFAGKFIMQKGRITITNVSDLGSYLRDEDEERHTKKLIPYRDDEDANTNSRT